MCGEWMDDIPEWDKDDEKRGWEHEDATKWIANMQNIDPEKSQWMPDIKENFRFWAFCSIELISQDIANFLHVSEPELPYNLWRINMTILIPFSSLDIKFRSIEVVVIA
jgi:hypothetical protein